MANKRGLGNGADALFDSSVLSQDNVANSAEMNEPRSLTDVAVSVLSDEESPSVTMARLPYGVSMDENGTLWVNPNLLKPNPHQPRQYFDEEKLAELTESVKKEGVLSPIIIEDAEDGTFYIIAGERRTRAARAAGLERVPVQLRKYSDARKLEVALVENIQRTDLNPVEEAEAYYEIMLLEGITQEEVAEKVGKSRSAVANMVRLLKLPLEMRNALASGTITSGHARALLSVADSSNQATLFKRILDTGLSVRQCEKQASDFNKGKSFETVATSASSVDTRDPNYVAMEQKFMDIFGTKVSFKGDFDKGRITIDYFSQSDLDKIYNRIVNGQ